MSNRPAPQPTSARPIGGNRRQQDRENIGVASVSNSVAHSVSGTSRSPNPVPPRSVSGTTCPCVCLQKIEELKRMFTGLENSVNELKGLIQELIQAQQTAAQREGDSTSRSRSDTSQSQVGRHHSTSYNR